MSQELEDDTQGIVAVCRLLHQQGLLAACDGNVSVRTNDHFLVTPRAVHKGFIDAKQCASVSFDGTILSGHPSSELTTHLAIYRSCPNARAVIHAHPPAAVAWTVAYPELTELPATALSEVIPAVGNIPVVPYHLPASHVLADAVAKIAEKHKVMILARHGCLCWGDSLQEAFWGVERLEHAARTLMYAQQMGQVTHLNALEVARLRDLREKIGEKTL